MHAFVPSLPLLLPQAAQRTCAGTSIYFALSLIFYNAFQVEMDEVGDRNSITRQTFTCDTKQD